MVLRKHTLYNIRYLSFEWICIYTNILCYELIKNNNILLKQECFSCVQVIDCWQFSDGTFFLPWPRFDVLGIPCYGEPLGLICLTAVTGYLYQIYLNQIKEIFIILILFLIWRPSNTLVQTRGKNNIYLHPGCPLSFETGGTMGYNYCFFLNFVPLHIESPYNFGGKKPSAEGKWACCYTHCNLWRHRQFITIFYILESK